VLDAADGGPDGAACTAHPATTTANAARPPATFKTRTSADISIIRNGEGRVGQWRATSVEGAAFCSWVVVEVFSRVCDAGPRSSSEINPREVRELS